MAKAKIALVEAQQAFEKNGSAAWDVFNEKRAELRRGLESEVRASNIADPDKIDSTALELLKSGIMTAEDYKQMAAKYDGNSTMTRLLSKFARDAAGVSDNVREKAALNAIAVTCADGLSSTMRQWDALEKISARCSGQAREGRTSAPAQIVAMSGHWEELTAEALENL